VGVTKILLVEDHPLFLEAARAALAAAEKSTVRFEVVGTASEGSQVLPLVNSLRPDLVLLDLGLPGMDGLIVLERLRRRFPELKVVVFSGRDDPESIKAALARGAAGYILKSIDPVDLVSALRQVVEQTAFVPLVTGQAAEAPPSHGLTEREASILSLVAQGLSNMKIGERLFVTEQTVKFHMSNIFRKLGAANRTEAAHLAYELGLASVLVQ
jgi:DNA-binding NarL/FixJ family response regulator